MNNQNTAPHQTEYEAAFLRGREAGAKIAIQSLDEHAPGRPVLIAPQGFEVKDLSHLLDRPSRIMANVRLDDVASFVAYVNRFKLEDQTMLFGNQASGTFEAAIDYHRPGVPSKSTHEAHLSLKFSPEWDAWKAKDNVPLKPQDLAKFIEEQLPVIAEPSGAKLLTAIRHFRAERNVTYNKVLSDTDNRTLELSYTDGTRAVSEVQVPAEFLLKLPVFKNGTPTPMVVKTEWKLGDEGALTFTLRRFRPDDVRDTAYNTARTEIEQATGLSLLLGSA